MANADHKPSQEWIQQFSDQPGDAALAHLLVNSLRLVSHNAFHQELTETKNRLITHVPEMMALYAARELSENQRYFPDKRRRPDATSTGGVIGSEGILSNVATNWSRAAPNQFLNHPPVSSLRRKTCHNIVVLDDLVGSGQRVKEFIAAMLRTDSIFSWWNYGLITFHVLAFAVSEAAEEAVRAEFRTRRSMHAHTHIRFWYSRRPTLGPHLWSEQQKSQLEDLCTRYGKKGKVKWCYYRGYQQSMGIVVFSHGCPNNLPGILWHPSSIVRPLFPNRTIPASLHAAFEQSGTASDPGSLLGSLNASALSHSSILDHLNPMAQNIIIVLAAIRKKITKPDRLCMATNLSQSLCESVLSVCAQHGLVDENRRITDRGIHELRSVLRLGNLPSEPPEFDNAFYYPRTLRGTRE